MDALQSIWQALNSPIGITAIAAALAWALGRLFVIRPAWKRYEGTIIAAIKHAEKMIPDNSANRALRRFDQALRYVLKVYEETSGKVPSEKTTQGLIEGIEIKHAELEAAGCLGEGAGGVDLRVGGPVDAKLANDPGQAIESGQAVEVKDADDEGQTG